MADAESSAGSSQYLESLSGDAAERITAMKWARYLGAAFGPSGALSALRYYARIDWISEDVRRTMVDYVRGLTIEELELSEVQPDLHGSLQNLADTEFERHARSLQFVAAISGRSIEHGLASLQLAESLGPGAGGGHAGVGAGAAGQPPSMGATGGPFVGGDLAPGEQAEMAAGGGQRQRDRSRRDERARRTGDLNADGSEASPTADRDDETSDDPADLIADTAAEVPGDDGSGGDAGETEDGTAGVEVSMADVTPGSVDRTDESADADGGSSVDDGGSVNDGDAEDDEDDGSEVAGDDGPALEPEAAVDAAESDIEPEVEPAPEPSPRDSSPPADGIVATFEDGNLGDATDAGSDSATEDASEGRDVESDGPESAPETEGDDRDREDDTLGEGNPEDEETPDEEGSVAEPDSEDGAESATEDEPLDGDEQSDDADPSGEEDPADEDRCIALTRDGDRCSRTATDGDDYCHQHAPEN